MQGVSPGGPGAREGQLRSEGGGAHGAGEPRAGDRGRHGSGIGRSVDVDERLDSLQSMIEPALTLVMGAVLGWVMVAVLGPVYDTISQVGS